MQPHCTSRRYCRVLQPKPRGQQASFVTLSRLALVTAAPARSLEKVNQLLNPRLAASHAHRSPEEQLVCRRDFTAVQRDRQELAISCAAPRQLSPQRARASCRPGLLDVQLKRPLPSNLKTSMSLNLGQVPNLNQQQLAC
jgi:hypothetical protein